MTIYLDCNATTPIDPEVMKVVRHYMEVEFGNAGSRTHEFGQRAKQAVERARGQVAAVAAAATDEVTFTSGATEANNLAILGLAEEGQRSGRLHIISTLIEHKAVLEPLEEMQRRGFEVTLLRPNRGGWIEPEQLRQALRPDTLLVSVMHINNETGIIQDIPGIAEVMSSHEAYLHVDAAQGYAKVAGIEHARVDLISMSGHKLFAPMGIGALIGRRRRFSRPPLTPLMYGGGQERGLRPGTLAVPLIAGLGTACERAQREQGTRMEKCKALARSLHHDLEGTLAEPVGDVSRRAPWVAGLRLRSVDSEAALLCLRGFAVSNGAACTSNAYEESHVLRAMSAVDEADGFIRISWSHQTPTSWPADLAQALGSLTSLESRASEGESH